MTKRHYQRQRRSDGVPASAKAIGDAKRLLAGTLARATIPHKLPESLRLMILGIFCHWAFFHWRGDDRVFPGSAKCEEWGKCKERTARSHLARLRRWGFLVPLGFERGGAGKATEYAVSTDALLRVLVMAGANPSRALYDALDACNHPRKNPAKPELERQSLQTLSAESSESKGSPLAVAKNPAKNPAMSAPRLSYLDTSVSSSTVETPLADAGEDRPNGPNAGMSQDCCEDGNAATAAPIGGRVCKPDLREPAALARLTPRRNAISEIQETGIPSCDQPSADARTLMGHLTNKGPATYGAAATSLSWGATRTRQAEADLAALGLIRFDRFGRAVPADQPL